MAGGLLDTWRRLGRWPGGRWLFGRLACRRAPYFATIAPRVLVLEPGRCEIALRDRRRVHNHIGTVHAIALCNLAELAAGLMAEASLPASMRWIPKGMTVQYLRKAVGAQRGVATPADPMREAAEAYELPVDVAILDAGGEAVMRARILLWISPRPPRPDRASASGA